ncbi:hypothetical protein LINPERPRIM_LOCUS29694 [Linum perenne]
MIDNRTFFVEYESLENICVTCGFYGHKAGCCPTLHTVQPLPGQPEEEVPPNGSIPEGDTGDWMIVQRRSRNKAKSEDREGNPKGSTVSSSSTPCRRF